MPRKFWLALSLVLIVSGSMASAKEITVFGVRSTLPLTNNEPVYKDYYINAGSESGLKPGLVITVNRRKSLYNAYQNQSPGDLDVEVGQLKIIHVQKNLSVARLYHLIPRQDQPVLDYDGIMVGDRLDLHTAKMAKGPSSAMNSAAPKPADSKLALPAPVAAPTPIVSTAPAPAATALSASAVKASVIPLKATRAAAVAKAKTGPTLSGAASLSSQSSSSPQVQPPQ